MPWARAAYPSSKPLGAWLRDLRRRAAFIADWLTAGEPCTFWLPGLAYPRGFATALLQNAARARGVPVDSLLLVQRVLQQEEAAALDPRARRRMPAGGCDGGSCGAADSCDEEGAVVYGLFLEGARWDDATGALAEARPREMLCPLPPIQLRPAPLEPAAGAVRRPRDARGAAGGATVAPPQQQQPHERHLQEPGVCGEAVPSSSASYECPLYATPARSDRVMTLRLPMPPGSCESHWVLRGAAALCSLDGDEDTGGEVTAGGHPPVGPAAGWPALQPRSS